MTVLKIDSKCGFRSPRSPNEWVFNIAHVVHVRVQKTKAPCVYAACTQSVYRGGTRGERACTIFTLKDSSDCHQSEMAAGWCVSWLENDSPLHPRTQKMHSAASGNNSAEITRRAKLIRWPPINAGEKHSTSALNLMRTFIRKEKIVPNPFPTLHNGCNNNFSRAVAQKCPVTIEAEKITHTENC